MSRLVPMLLVIAMMALAIPLLPARSADVLLGRAAKVCYNAATSTMVLAASGDRAVDPTDQLYFDVARGRADFLSLSLRQQLGYSIWAGVVLNPGVLSMCGR